MVAVVMMGVVVGSTAAHAAREDIRLCVLTRGREDRDIENALFFFFFLLLRGVLYVEDRQHFS